MLWNSSGRDIFVETFFEKTAICSWMYMRNVSLDHRPIFLMVSWEMLFRCIAMAPPARRLWEPTWLARSPLRARPRSVTACLTAVLMSVGPTMRPLCARDEKYVPMHVDGSDVWDWICLTRRIRARIGQCVHATRSWCILWLRRPFFWLEMLSVAEVHLALRTSTGRSWGRRVVLCQNATSWTRKCCVRRRSDGRWYVYSPTRRR